MKKLFFALFVTSVLASCSVESFDDYENYNVDRKKIERPGTQAVDMAEVDKHKVRRPGSQIVD